MDIDLNSCSVPAPEPVVPSTKPPAAVARSAKVFQERCSVAPEQWAPALEAARSAATRGAPSGLAPGAGRLGAPLVATSGWVATSMSEECDPAISSHSCAHASTWAVAEAAAAAVAPIHRDEANVENNDTVSIDVLP